MRLELTGALCCGRIAVVRHPTPETSGRWRARARRARSSSAIRYAPARRLLMIKTLPTLVLSLAAFTSGASQQPAPVHRWTPVVAKPDVRIELDTATATRTDHHRRAWLRWTFPTPVPDLADVQLERREVDCARGLTRVLAVQTHEAGPSPTLGVATPPALFFQAEDGIRDLTVTGVQTCALPI